MIIKKYNQEDYNEVIKLICNTICSINIKDYNNKKVQSCLLALNNHQNKLSQMFLNNYSVIAILDDLIIGFGSIDIN